MSTLPTQPITPQQWADALGSVPALNADVVFIQSALVALIELRRPAAGDKAALNQIADDAVYVTNAVFDRLNAQFKPATN